MEGRKRQLFRTIESLLRSINGIREESPFESSPLRIIIVITISGKKTFIDAETNG